MNILLIRLRLVGDVVFTTPAIKAVRRRFPDARITYLVERAAAPVVLGNPHLDDVLVVPHVRGWQRVRDDLRLARELRARRFDLVIDFHGGPRGSLLTWASGAPRRIGYTITGRSWMYTDRVERARDLRPRHSVENQWDLLEPLGIPPLHPAREPVEMVESADARTRVHDRLASAGVPEDAPLIVIHVSAGNPFRRWPLPSFARLAIALAASSPDRHVILTAGPSEADAAATVAREALDALGPSGAGRILLGDDLDLAELRVLIGGAAVYIGGDSGPMHIAATTATPMVSLYGPTLPARSAPWRPGGLVSEAVEPENPLACRPCDQRACVTGDFRCLSDTSWERVAAAAERALAAAHTRGYDDAGGADDSAGATPFMGATVH